MMMMKAMLHGGVGVAISGGAEGGGALGEW